jgi:Helix-turn-helix domain
MDRMLDEFDEWLTEQEAAAALHKSVRTLRKWRGQRKGPPYIYVGRSVKYRKPALIAHYRASEITPVRTQRGTRRVPA